jgi:hypothetical protein
MTAQMTMLSPRIADSLAESIRGEVIGPEHPRYDEARTVYNGMIDRYPAAVVQCANAADVIAAVNFAREEGLLVAIRGGGHNGPGLGTCDGGLVIDLSPMNNVRIDPEARTARVGGGALLGDIDHAAQPFGLVLPTGILSTTGIGGLTLGGGLGHLTRKFGLTIDNLLEADVVLADGNLVTASADRHEDLFWAIRGGGGNFGVVTSFVFQLHPLDGVVAGPTFWELDQAGAAMTWYRSFIGEAPEELNGFFAFMTVPPAPPFPEELHMKKVCGVFWCYAGDQQQDAERLLASVEDAGTPLLHDLQPMPYAALQSAFDGLYPPGLNWYWKADFFKELPDKAIAQHVEHGSQLPTMHSTMHLYPIDGATHRVSSDETAFNHREARWAEVIVGVDPDDAMTDDIISWARAYWEALHPFSAGGAYVNMMMEEGQDRVRASYGDNYARLVEVKRRYDPENFFRVNQNIDPAQ